MSLQAKINEDLKAAIKRKDQNTLPVLRMLKSDIQYELAKTGASSLDDEKVLSIIKKAMKQREESAGEYERAGREDLKQREEHEAEILSSYLPPPLSREEILELIAKLIKENPPTKAADSGKYVGKAMQELKGKNIDGALVALLVKEEIQKLF
ncbi:MAG: GatB/YqeY domain-containing protein [Leptospiraceae bacterium]|nr:GatB/YqeY domain-containing protein [Leptospiraceae bacterium]